MEAREGERPNRELYHKGKGEGKYKQLYQLLTRAERQPQKLTRIRSEIQYLLDAKFTEVKNQLDKSRGEGKIKLTGTAEKQASSSSSVPELPPARGWQSIRAQHHTLPGVGGARAEPWEHPRAPPETEDPQRRNQVILWNHKQKKGGPQSLRSLRAVQGGTTHSILALFTTS